MPRARRTSRGPHSCNEKICPIPARGAATPSSPARPTRSRSRASAPPSARLAVVSASALDAQRLSEELAWFAPALARVPAAGLGNAALRPVLAAPGPGLGAPGHAVPDPARRIRPRGGAGADRAGAPVPAVLPRRAHLLPPGRRTARRRRAAPPAAGGRLPARDAGGGAGRILHPRRHHRPVPDGQRAAAARSTLDDERIDTIRTFDVDSQRTLYPVQQVRLLPAREFPLDEAGRARFRSRFRELFEGDPSKKALYRDVSNGVPAAGVEYYLPLFFDAAATLFDYLPPGATLALHHDVAAAIDGVLARRAVALQAARRRPRPAAARARRSCSCRPRSSTCARAISPASTCCARPSPKRPTSRWWPRRCPRSRSSAAPPTRSGAQGVPRRLRAARAAARPSPPAGARPCPRTSRSTGFTPIPAAVSKNF